MSVSDLRPHHALCTGFFEGKGYSREFTENMAAVIRQLKSGSKVRLICSADAVCSACPNDFPEGCTSQDKVERYDRAVLRLCGLTEGETIQVSELVSRVKKNIITAGRLGEVCGDCCWSEICGSKEYEM